MLFSHRTFARQWSYDECSCRNLREIHQFANGEHKKRQTQTKKRFEHSIFHFSIISCHLLEFLSRRFYELKCKVCSDNVSTTWCQTCRVNRFTTSVTLNSHRPGSNRKKSLSCGCSIYSHVKTIIVLSKAVAKNLFKRKNKPSVFFLK